MCERQQAESNIFIVFYKQLNYIDYFNTLDTRSYATMCSDAGLITGT